LKHDEKLNFKTGEKWEKSEDRKKAGKDFMCTNFFQQTGHK